MRRTTEQKHEHSCFWSVGRSIGSYLIRPKRVFFAGPLTQPSQEVAFKGSWTRSTRSKWVVRVSSYYFDHFVLRPRRGQEVCAGCEGETHYASQSTCARSITVRDALSCTDSEDATSLS
ncbi:hypothetical protein MRX96_057003 [Rhipicephalus microplus]